MINKVANWLQLISDFRYATDDDIPGDDENSDSADTGLDDSTSASGKSGENAGDKINDPKSKALHEEAAKWRNDFRKTQKELAAAQQRLKEIDLQGKSELEKTVAERDEIKQKYDALLLENQQLKLRSAFDKLAVKANFIDFDDAFAIIVGSKKVQFDEDGNPEGIDELVKNAIKTKPYLVKSEENSNGSKLPKTEPANGSKGKDQLDREALMKKFPALRR